MSEKIYDYAVIGGGEYGMSIAYNLSKYECEIALIQQFKLGHINGSSHGSTRISRSAYDKPAYRDLANLANQIYWPQLESTLGVKILHENKFAYFDNNEVSYKKYKQVALNNPNQFTFVTNEQVAQEYPQLKLITTKYQPILDSKGHIVLAGKFIQKLSQFLRQKNNMRIFEQTEVLSIIDSGKFMKIKTINREILAKQIVVSCGKWVTQLVPLLKSIVYTKKQTVSYLKMKSPNLYTIGKIPSYMYRDKNTIFYSLPDFETQNYKFAEHSIFEKDNDEEPVQKIKKAAKKIYGEEFIEIGRIEHCYYTMTRSQDFIIDWVDPADNKILICSCCSGHGFKFAPLIGKVVADIVRKNPMLQLFQKYRYQFEIPYHLGINLID